MQTNRGSGVRGASGTPAAGYLALAAMGLVFALILADAWLRLVGAGLGCPGWPACYAKEVAAGQPLASAARPIAAMLAFALLTWLWARRRRWARPIDAEPLAALLWPARIAIAVIAAQIALGAWVGANHAALACTGLPACNGQWWPRVDFASGFGLASDAGAVAGSRLSQAALTAIHLAHRIGAVATLLVVGWVGWRALRSHGAASLGWALIGALVVQWLLGLAGALFGLPGAVAIAHAGAAAVLLGAAVVLHFRACRAQFWI